MNSKPVFSQIIAYALAFVLPPLIIGIVAIAFSFSALMHGSPEHFLTQGVNFPSFDNVLQDLARRENKPLAEIVAKTLEDPVDSTNLEGKSLPIWLFLKPLAIALASVIAIAIILNKKYVSISEYFEGVSKIEVTEEHKL